MKERKRDRERKSGSLICWARDTEKIFKPNKIKKPTLSVIFQYRPIIIFLFCLGMLDNKVTCVLSVESSSITFLINS